jgi:hypothetical protein
MELTQKEFDAEGKAFTAYLNGCIAAYGERDVKVELLAMVFLQAGAHLCQHAGCPEGQIERVVDEAFLAMRAAVTKLVGPDAPCACPACVVSRAAGGQGSQEHH